MGRWDQSSPQRVTAWYGIRMVHDINGAYLNPLKPLFPDYRLGPEGDGPKVACETCHKGVFKPLYGISMLGDYPELAGPMPIPSAAPTGEPEAQPTSAPDPVPAAEPIPQPTEAAAPPRVMGAL